MRHPIRSGLIALGLLLAIALPGQTQSPANADEPLDAQLNEQVLSVPVDTAPEVRLQVTLFKPQGTGPFPLAVLNHGKDVGPTRAAKRYRSVYAARYFLSRGYAVALPMLRGYAGSEGETWTRGCDAEHEGLLQARDIGEVIRYLGKEDAFRNTIDTSRVVVSGQSLGGWNTLAMGAVGLPAVKGLVNFAGGRQAPACPSWQADLAVAAGRFGARTRIPSIWFYGDNDTKFSVDTWRGMLERYNAAGGKAELVAYGRFMDDAHNFLGKIEALPIWTPRLDAFLDKLGLPNRNLHPELLPEPYPQPTAFAAVNDVAAVPLLNDKGRDTYRAFLNRRMPRVFVIASNGSCIATDGGYDPLERARALCKTHHLSCQTYAVDDHVVWPAP
jgi:dienelactone hydrolase